MLSGEAGIGKSRLAAQLAAEVANEPHTRLRYQCSPYHRDSVLHPFVVALGRAAGLAPEDAPKTQLDKLEAILAPARIAETAPLFASLLSIPTGERYVPLALSAAQQRRLTVFFEDNKLARLEGDVVAQRTPEAAASGSGAARP